MWFELKGGARLGRCATEGCGGQPTFRLEAEGVGSNYCSGCKERIDAHAPQRSSAESCDLTELARRHAARWGDHSPSTVSMLEAFGKRLLRDVAQGTSLRDALLNALDSPTISALSKIFSVRGIFFDKSYSEQVADVLYPRLAAQPPAAPVEFVPETCPDCGVREPCDEDCPNHVEPEPVSRLSAATEGETKTVYVKRWRTLVKLPAKYADEIVAALRVPVEPQTSAVKLGDLVELNHLCPYHEDFRGAQLRLVSLRLGPDGEQWATVMEGDPRHRGYGVYDAETDGIRLSWLSSMSRPNRGSGE